MQHLIQKRQEIEKLRTSSSISTVQAEQLGKSIASSWQRSNSAEIPKDRFAAPISEGSMSQGSALQHALSYCVGCPFGVSSMSRSTASIASG